MLKFLVGAAAFVVSAALGVGVLMIWAILILLLRRNDPHAGTGAFAGGLTHDVVLIVPLVCGAVGAFLAVRKYSRGPQS
jgi:hypothetical protein